VSHMWPSLVVRRPVMSLLWASSVGVAPRRIAPVSKPGVQRPRHFSSGSEPDGVAPGHLRMCAKAGGAAHRHCAHVSEPGGVAPPPLCPCVRAWWCSALPPCPCVQAWWCSAPPLRRCVRTRWCSVLLRRAWARTRWCNAAPTGGCGPVVDVMGERRTPGRRGHLPRDRPGRPCRFHGTREKPEPRP
jgi:hypothetical protein